MPARRANISDVAREAVIGHAASEVEPERRYLQLLTTYRVEAVIVNASVVRNSTRESPMTST